MLRHPLRPSERGLSLVELLVAVAIGLLMMTAFVAAFANMKSAFNTQDQLGQLQDGERLALSMLTSTIQSAGYFPINPLNLNTDAAARLPENAPFAAGQAITGTPAGAAAGETVSVRFFPEGGAGAMTNCLGNVNAAAAGLEVNTFEVNAANELTCTIGAGLPVTLVSNVQAMAVLYGVDTNAADPLLAGSITQYLPVKSMTASTWPNVRSVRITLTFINPYGAQASAAASALTWTHTITLMNRIPKAI